VSAGTQLLTAPVTMVQALNTALRAAMEADPRVLVMGEDDLTLVSYGAAIKTCLAAAEEAAGRGRAIEVIDLRSLSPLDTGPLAESVTRTGRCVVVHEAPVFGGYGAELAARITQQCFYHLEAPVLRVGGYDTPYPPSRLEEYYLPGTGRILDAIDDCFGW
jgi:2-oxoisovalerate dehydrogenase E1 component beta subunit